MCAVDCIVLYLSLPCPALSLATLTRAVTIPNHFFFFPSPQSPPPRLPPSPPPRLLSHPSDHRGHIMSFKCAVKRLTNNSIRLRWKMIYFLVLVCFRFCSAVVLFFFIVFFVFVQFLSPFFSFSLPHLNVFLFFFFFFFFKAGWCDLIPLSAMAVVGKTSVLGGAVPVLFVSIKIICLTIAFENVILFH